MKKWKQLLCVALAATTAFGMCACGSKSDNGGTEAKKETETKGALDLEGMSYEEQSQAVYDYCLGEFYKYYQEALEITDDNNMRFAKMAIAEAKLLESGVLCPTQGNYGMYQMSRTAPKSGSSVYWGLDDERYDKIIKATEFIKKEDYTELKTKWAELKGTGKYRDYAIKFLKEKGYKLSDKATRTYATEPATFDLLASSRTADSYPVVNTIEALIHYNEENELIPGLAEALPEVSEDGLTYTFKIKQGLKWVDAQEREIDDVQADDFVASMQHACDAQGGLEFLLEGCILNADKYIAGDITDFSEVGVKAVDKYTLQYTLEKPCPYFTSMFGYSVFFPMCRSFYESQGGKFGTEYDNSVDSYKYGKTPNNIAYCGAYVIKSYTQKNSIVYKPNKAYWDKDSVTIKNFTYLYNDGADLTKNYKAALKGDLDGISLTGGLLETAKKDGNFDKYAIVSDVDGTTFASLYNLNRSAYCNFNDESKVVSTKSDEEKDRTKKAMLNQNFRLALNYGFDRASYNAQRAGEECKNFSLKNSWTDWDLVYTTEDVTVDINGTPTEFKAGTSYGEMVQAQVTADGYPFKVYDPEANDGAGSGVGYDGWYNPDEAKKAIEAAAKELADQGVTIDKDHPIYLDITVQSTSEVFMNRTNAYKQSLEAALGGYVVLVINEVADPDTWSSCGYACSNGYEMNYDIYDYTGWGPDYGDPSTFLDTMAPGGYETKNLGMY